MEAQSIVEIFEAHANAAPERCAVRLRDGDVSYGDLNAMADAVAAELLARRGHASDPVPLLVWAPELLLAAALGALKAGKCFAPVNPGLPTPRVRQMLDELAAPVVLCDERGASVAGAGAVAVEGVVVARARAASPGLAFEGGRLAHILYTSGSTGRPKAIAQTRRDMLHNLRRHAPLDVGSRDCVTLISSDGFVGSVSNPYLALHGGAALAPYSFKDAGVDRVLEWLADARVTVFYGFPSFLRLLGATLDDPHPAVRLAYLGGETVLPADLSAARRLFPYARLAVGLNSTETGLTCLNTIAPGTPLPATVSVGRAVEGIEIAIVDSDGTPVSPGEPGEIEIRSPYVGPRCWPENTVGGPRFRTGDRGRVDGDGAIVHLGRADGMVKIRGFRVETAEVEAVIAALPSVAEVAVIPVSDHAGDNALAAYVVGRSLDPMNVRAAVAAVLPTAMIPATVTVLNAMPRTPNGKLDRKALPIPRGASAGPAPQPADRTTGRAEIEAALISIWCTVLRTDRIDPKDDFFLLGGTSISALAVITRVRRHFGVPVPLAVLFETPTVAALADAVLAQRDEKGLT
jgi:peptide synthetase PhsA